MKLKKFLTIAALLAAPCLAATTVSAAEWDEETEALYLSCVAKYVEYGMGTQSQAEQHCYALYYGSEGSGDGDPNEVDLPPVPGNSCYGNCAFN